MSVNPTTLQFGIGITSPVTRSEPRSTTSAVRHEPARQAYCSDPALIRACLDGDKRAWNELVTRYQRLVYSIPRRYGLAPEDCDDVFQNVFTIVFRRLGSLRDQTCLSAWLITITHRECQRSAKHALPQSELDESLVDTTTLSTEDVQRWERQRLLHQALSQLDSRNQALLKALFFDKSTPSYREIAEQLGMAEGSIAPTRSRCFKKLEAILNTLDPDMFA